MSKAGFLQQLAKRRVVQIVGIYLGAAWVCVEFADWLVSRYALSPRVTDTVLVVLISLLPSVIVLAWNHGARGPDEWTRLERFLVPCNGLVTTAIALLVLQSAPGLVAAESVTVTDETGQAQTFLVPKEQFRRTVLIYPLERPDLAGTPAVEMGPVLPDFLAHALPFLLTRDLKQSVFIEAGNLYTNDEWGILSRLQRAGMEGRLDLPLNLQREIAEENDYAYFVAGSVQAAGDGVRADLTVYDSGTGGPIAEVAAQMDDLFALADRLSADIYQALELPAAGAAGSQDLPVSEISTGSEPALRALLQGMNRRLFDNDFELAIANYRQALDIDPDFSLAAMLQGLALANAGGIEESRQLLQTAQRLSYRLLESERTQLKGVLYSLNDEPEKVVALYSMWTEIQPQSLEAWVNLANALNWETREFKLALLTFKQAYQLAPDQTWMLTRMSELAEAIGDTDQALEILDQLIALEPDSHVGHAYRGVLLLDQGQLDAAEQDLERAMLMRADVITPRIRMADLQLRRGNLAGAAQYIAEAEQVAASQSQRAIVALTKAQLLDIMGRQADASDAYLEAYEIALTYRKPADAIAIYLVPGMEPLGRRGQLALGEQRLEEASAQLLGYQQEMQSLGLAVLYAAAGQLDAAAQHLDVLAAIEDEFLLRFVAPMMEDAHGLIALQCQDYAAAAGHFSESLQHAAKLEGDMTLAALRTRVRLAASLRLNGDNDAAQEQLELVLERFPNHPLALLERARMQHQRGRNTAAGEALQTAMAVWSEADDDFSPARQAQTLLETVSAE